MDLSHILNGLSYGYRLKREPRHCWYENGEAESVAEHSWRLAYFAMLVGPHLTVKYDRDKLLRIIIMHDIAEAVTGDYPAFVAADVKAEKARRERAAVEQIRSDIGEAAGRELYDLWHEYEGRQSIEARIAAALDKLEAIVSHLESPMERWTPEDAPYFSVERYQSHFDVDPVIERLFRQLLADVEVKIATEMQVLN